MQRDRLREALAYFVPLLISAAVLAALGLVSVRAWSDEEGVKQGVFLCVGLAAMLAVQLVSYRDLLVISPILLGLSLLLVMYTVAGRFVTVPLVHETNRAWLWITVGPIKLQPSELVKIALIMVMAWFTKDESRRLHSFRTMLSFVALLGVSAGLIVMQPDLGTALTLIPPTFALMLLAGNIGVNIGVAAPMAFFPFSGWKESFFGDLHAQSSHAVEFYTQTKVVIERWNEEWTRKF